MGKLSQNAVPLEVAAIARNTQQRTVTGAGPGDGSPAPTMSSKQQEMPRTRGTSCAGAAASACSKWLGTSPARLASLLLCEVVHRGQPAPPPSWGTCSPHLLEPSPPRLGTFHITDTDFCVPLPSQQGCHSAMDQERSSQTIIRVVPCKICGHLLCFTCRCQDQFSRNLMCFVLCPPIPPFFKICRIFFSFFFLQLLYPCWSERAQRGR